MSSDIRLDLTGDGVEMYLESPFPSGAEAGSGLCWNLAVSEIIAGPVPSGASSISCSATGSSSGRGKRRTPGLMVRNRRTLIAPERENIKLAKNVTVGDTWW
jgi:hypothetical protein